MLQLISFSGIRSSLVGIMNQSFGEKKGAAFKDQSWGHKIASVLVSPFKATYRIANAFRWEFGGLVVGAVATGFLVPFTGIAFVGSVIVGAALGVGIVTGGKFLYNKFFTAEAKAERAAKKAVKDAAKAAKTVSVAGTTVAQG